MAAGICDTVLYPVAAACYQYARTSIAAMSEQYRGQRRPCGERDGRGREELLTVEERGTRHEAREELSRATPSQ